MSKLSQYKNLATQEIKTKSEMIDFFYANEEICEILNNRNITAEEFFDSQLGSTIIPIEFL
jgi:hypothetical protein